MKKTLIALATLAALSTASLAQTTKTDTDKKMRDEVIIMTQKMVDEMTAEIDRLAGMLNAYQRQVKRMLAREQGDD